MLICHVLIIEDDSTLALLLQNLLHSRSGYQCAVVHSMAEALLYLQDQPVDLILLDLSLPDADGLDVLQYLALGPDMPVIVISGRQDDDSRIAALSLGADDYLCKPFHPGELLLRVDKRWQAAQAMRQQRASQVSAPGSLAETGRCLRIGEQLLVLDRQHQCVAVGEQQMRLTTIEFLLLAALVDGAGRILTADQLLDALEHTLGDDHEFAPASLPVLIHRIRRKLARLCGDEPIINTVPRRGYQLCPSVAALL